ncbi:hypothetical protein A1O1_03976 [Capronia coronata CBS 617.96]|uniref:Transmembrane protein n=1 Tax=Capronia coronata CBS 617.96 TaxID=1182541 RepID=W9YNT5_9EURO|nr:uncharacterized protein A1O1_03976 [Capronia coronata CBS 617.96]EXJ90871.1 hypothetical protein A1O1_03976 [Capronia coronata CBS 617.96]
MARTALDDIRLCACLRVTLFLCLNLYAGSTFAQSDDGGAATGVEPGDIGSDPDSQSSTDAGAAGPDTGAVNLSRGATIAIAVVVSVVVVLGTTLTVLYFLAKKRQWKVKEGLRRSARRVGSAVKAVTTPLTPKRMNFPRSSTATRKGRYLGNNTGGLLHKNGTHALAEDGHGARSHTGRSGGGMHDVEKGLPVSAVRVESETESVNSETRTQTQHQGERKDGSRPRPSKVEIPSSSFEMDSIPKTPVWKKVFGR